MQANINYPVIQTVQPTTAQTIVVPVQMAANTQYNNDFRSGMFSICDTFSTCLIGVLCPTLNYACAAMKYDESFLTGCFCPTALRTHVRHTDRIEGTVLCDGLAVYMCYSCVSCQIANQRNS